MHSHDFILTQGVLFGMEEAGDKAVVHLEMVDVPYRSLVGNLIYGCPYDIWSDNGCVNNEPLLSKPTALAKGRCKEGAAVCEGRGIGVYGYSDAS